MYLGTVSQFARNVVNDIIVWRCNMAAVRSSMHMCVYVCICIHVHISMHMYACICAYVCVCWHVHAYVCMCADFFNVYVFQII